MRLALEEARRGRTSPNPRVGAVIVADGRVVAQGHHTAAGRPHAEVEAIRNANQDLRGATLYVTLEPCNHQGRTGPCTEAVIAAGIARVVIGCADPASHGPRGVDRLAQAGVEVELGVLEAEASALVADFAKHVTTGMPWVTLKAAVTLDGKIATRTGDSRWITSERARAQVHRMRSDADAILVGVGTVLADDPSLTVRHVQGPDPVRVILDADLRTPTGASILDPSHRSSAPTWVFHADDATVVPGALGDSPHVELISVPRSPRGLDLRAVLTELGARGVMRLLVEGGGQIHGSFFTEQLADGAAIFVAPRILGDPLAPSFVAGGPVETMAESVQLFRTRSIRIGADWLITGDFREGG